MNYKLTEPLFIVILLALYVFFNASRNLLFSLAPSFFEESKLTLQSYGLLSSTASIVFGISRFLSYSVMEIISIDKYVTSISIVISAIAIGMGLMTPDSMGMSSSTFLYVGFLSLFFTLGLVFPCSSIIVRKYMPLNYRTLLWSLLAITSCVGAMLQNSLAFFLQSPSRLFLLTARFGIYCAFLFYIFFPTSEEKAGNVESVKSPENETRESKKREFVLILLCFASHFSIYLCRRTMAEWTSVYTEQLFSLPASQIKSIYTMGKNLFEIASAVSLLIFGIMSMQVKSWNISKIITTYTSLAAIAVALPQAASFLNLPWLYYVASFLSGLFLSVPYSSMELLLMDICREFGVNRVLSYISLSSLVAGASAGFPTNYFFTHVCRFQYMPLIHALLLIFASICLWIISSLKSKIKMD